MTKQIGTLTFTVATVAGAQRVAASQDGRLVTHAPDVAGLVSKLKGMGLTGTLKRGIGPVFTHDCPCCTFLGRTSNADVFKCGGSLIARTGDQGSDNVSMPLALAGLIAAPGASGTLPDAFWVWVKAGSP